MIIFSFRVGRIKNFYAGEIPIRKIRKDDRNKHLYSYDHLGNEYRRSFGYEPAIESIFQRMSAFRKYKKEQKFTMNINGPSDAVSETANSGFTKITETDSDVTGIEERMFEDNLAVPTANKKDYDLAIPGLSTIEDNFAVPVADKTENDLAVSSSKKTKNSLHGPGSNKIEDNFAVPVADKTEKTKKTKNSLHGPGSNKIEDNFAVPAADKKAVYKALDPEDNDLDKTEKSLRLRRQKAVYKALDPIRLRTTLQLPWKAKQIITWKFSESTGWRTA